MIGKSTRRRAISTAPRLRPRMTPDRLLCSFGRLAPHVHVRMIEVGTEYMIVRLWDGDELQVHSAEINDLWFWEMLVLLHMEETGVSNGA